MKFLLGFLLVSFVVGLRSGMYDREMRRWPVIVGSSVLALGFLSLRVINE